MFDKHRRAMSESQSLIPIAMARDMFVAFKKVCLLMRGEKNGETRFQPSVFIRSCSEVFLTFCGNEMG